MEEVWAILDLIPNASRVKSRYDEVEQLLANDKEPA